MSITTTSGEHEEGKTTEVSPESLDPLVGQTLDNRFLVVDVVGSGAMGKVYRAVQLPLNRAVALKVLDSTWGAGREESFKQRFLVEAALHAKLNHPNTVRVVDYGHTHDGLYFLAMEYLDGETLETVLKQGALPWHRVLTIGLQMARALREAHELGVVHRDLKPANVVLLNADDDSDFVKVVDFGLVKSFVEGHELEGRAITQQGMLLGSPPYMAPEQGEKNRADPRSDLYSLGVMLYEMLTGRPPFIGNSALDVIMKHVNEPVPPLNVPPHREPPPAALTSVVTRCLAKSPMDRFQSMDELIVALQEVSPSRAPAPVQVKEPPQEPTEIGVPAMAMDIMATQELPQRRSRWPLIVGFFLAAAVGIGGTWLAIRPAPPAAKVTFQVSSAPAGAKVSSNGQVLGVTPLTLEQLAGATLSLRLEKHGYAPVDFTLMVDGVRSDFSTTLSALPPAP